MKTPVHSGLDYEILYQNDQPQSNAHTINTPPVRCYQRCDDVGINNTFKAWHLYSWHIAVCFSLFFVIIYRVEGHEFNTGSPPWIFQTGAGLYQTQVSGLVSAALVFLRILVGSCTILLIWRIIFILLEKEGLTLLELTRLSNTRLPSLHFTSWKRFLWSCCAALATILMWAPSFSAPLATSSIAWLPWMRISTDQTAFPVSSLSSGADWLSMVYLDSRVHDVLHATQMTGKDPAYAFNSSQLPLRRYVSIYESIPDKSLADLTVPYFDVQINWIDAANDSRTLWINNSTLTNVTESGVQTRRNGSVQLFLDPVPNFGNAAPKGPAIFRGERLIAVKVATWNSYDRLDNGSLVTADSPCPGHASVFGQLPNVTQHSIPYRLSDQNSTFAAIDCYLLAEISITAGQYTARECVMNSAGPNVYTATCETDFDENAIKDDWLTELALDYVPEVMKYSVMLNTTEPWMENNLKNHTAGLLTLAYHAAWSSLTERLGDQVETASVRLAEEVVLAVVDRTKLYGWLAMNASLTASAILVCLMQRSSTKKTVRDPTLAALTIDLTDVSHSRQAYGLCNATGLRKSDKELPRLRWRTNERRRDGEIDMSEEGGCTRAVTFM